MKQNSVKSKGVTLLELVISFGILSLISVIATYYYQMYSESSNIENLSKFASIQNHQVVEMIKKALNQRIMNPPAKNPDPMPTQPVLLPSYEYTVQLRAPTVNGCHPLNIRGRVVNQTAKVIGLATFPPGSTTGYRITKIENICGSSLGYADTEYKKMGGVADGCNPANPRPLARISVWNDEALEEGENAAFKINWFPADVSVNEPNPVSNKVVSTQVCVTPVPSNNLPANLANISGLKITVSSMYPKNRTSLAFVSEQIDFNFGNISLRGDASYPFIILEASSFEILDYEN